MIDDPASKEHEEIRVRLDKLTETIKSASFQRKGVIITTRRKIPPQLPITHQLELLLTHPGVVRVRELVHQVPLRMGGDLFSVTSVVDGGTLPVNVRTRKT